MPEFAYQELLPIGADETPYRLLTSDHVTTFTAEGRRFVQVEPEALTMLTSRAMFDIAHLLRPGHLAQLRAMPANGFWELDGRRLRLTNLDKLLWPADGISKRLWEIDDSCGSKNF